MSSNPPLQCLFCNHLNPGEASFCNHCGSQMHLQPCDRCGAINKRTAKNCYKCESSFTLPGASEPETKTVSPQHQASDSRQEEVDTDFAHTSANFDQIDPAVETPQAYHMVPSHNEVSTNRSRSLKPLVTLLTLVAAVSVSVYFYFERAAPLVPKQVAAQLVPPERPAPVSVNATVPMAPAPVEPVEPVATSASVAPMHVAKKVVPDDIVTMAPPGAGITLAAPPAPTPSILQECPQAVATLGFCSPVPKQEKP